MESKIDATDRLRRDGRWTEASAYRDHCRSELRAQGLSKNEANEKAWAAMIQKYPPTEESEIDDFEVVEFDEEVATPANSEDWVRDILFAYNNMERKMPEMAPGAGAASLLNWARRNQDKFFESLLPKALSVTEKRQTERKRFEDDGRKISNRVEAFLADFRKQQLEALEKNANRFARKLAPKMLDCKDQAEVPDDYLKYLSRSIIEVINDDPGLGVYVE